MAPLTARSVHGCRDHIYVNSICTCVLRSSTLYQETERQMRHTCKRRAKDGRYYDLVRIPHGHIPAPIVNFWSRLPLPIKEYRGWDFFYCPFCGRASFFKGICWDCSEYLPDSEYRYYRARLRREYFRKLWKRLEYMLLPFLVVIGKAWYVSSRELHYWDLVKEEIGT